ncbi:MAG TPA: hypothetical protein VEJ47_17350 [Candidatus Eremiobacteraceae bacterium]|jgi:hypothetical protein|nr:hypothetical protein [Candidatus Eremiobacteraceae bacterium]
MANTRHFEYPDQFGLWVQCKNQRCQARFTAGSAFAESAERLAKTIETYANPTLKCPKCSEAFAYSGSDMNPYPRPSADKEWKGLPTSE